MYGWLGEVSETPPFHSLSALQGLPIQILKLKRIDFIMNSTSLQIACKSKDPHWLNVPPHP